MVPGGVGRCGVVFVAVLLTVAAGRPMIRTLALRTPVSVPEKTCGSGVGTGGPGGAGTITM
jgi:hypothetical protein